MTDSKQAGVSDRELLELAAKAAGYAVTISGEWHDKGRAYVDASPWDPLTDDGDALRLAVKLGLSFRCKLKSDHSKCGSTTVGYFRSNQVGEPHNSDPYAATRRAIVRAAASLAKGEGNG